jgi:hypothetical protein
VDRLTFISKVVEALAWPIAFYAVLLVIRKELPAIIRSLRKLKFKDFELEFGEAAKAVAAEAKEAVPSSKPNISLAGQPREEIALHLAAIAEISPRAAILESWLQVERAAADIIQKRSMSILSSMPGPMRLRDGLIRLGILNEKQLEVFESLRTLRNEAVHYYDAEFSKAAIANYIEAAITIAVYLEEVATDS